MNVQIEESWKQHLAPEFEKDYFIRLTEFVRSEYQTATIYPVSYTHLTLPTNPRV